MADNDYNLDREIEDGLARADEMLYKQKRRQWLYFFLWLSTLVGAFFLGFWVKPTSTSSPTLINSGLYFSSNRSGQFEIYYLGPDGKLTQITYTQSGQSWGATLAPTGMVYFVSDRDGKREIYAFQANEVVRVTTSPGNSSRWDPHPTLWGLYFVSDRSGRNEVYFLDAAGTTHQVTNTSGLGESLFSVEK